MFPYSGCKSWFGQEHVKCSVPKSLSFSDAEVCTPPKYMPSTNGSVDMTESTSKVASSCRKCIASDFRSKLVVYFLLFVDDVLGSFHIMIL